MSRDDFTTKTKDILAKRVGFVCSKCRSPTSGPHDDPQKATSIGVAAHIHAASAGGPRYLKTMSSEQRASIENGIWLCASCSVLIDKDPDHYPPSTLRDWKRQAERSARDALERSLPAAPQRSEQGIAIHVGELVFRPNDSGLGTVEAPWGRAEIYQRDGVMHIEQETKAGRKSHFTMDQQGGMEALELPFPLGDYAVEFHEPDVVSRVRHPSTDGSITQVTLIDGHCSFAQDQAGRLTQLQARASITYARDEPKMMVSAYRKPG